MIGKKGLTGGKWVEREVEKGRLRHFTAIIRRGPDSNSINAALISEPMPAAYGVAKESTIQVLPWPNAA